MLEGSRRSAEGQEGRSRSRVALHMNRLELGMEHTGTATLVVVKLMETRKDMLRSRTTAERKVEAVMLPGELEEERKDMIRNHKDMLRSRRVIQQSTARLLSTENKNSHK